MDGFLWDFERHCIAKEIIEALAVLILLHVF